MKAFEFIAPSSLDKALEIMAGFGARAKVIAGGTDLVINLRSGIVDPEYVVDIESLRELRSIEEEEGGIRIGAATKIAEIEESVVVRRAAPVLAQAASQVGAVQTRGLATIAGNLASAVPSADMAPPLMAMDAVLTVKAARRERRIPVESLFKGPKATVLEPDEIITEVFVPRLGPNERSCFVKLGRRKALTLAIVNVAVRLAFADDGVVSAARICLGAVAPTPIRARDAEACLVGKPATEERLEAAAEKASSECSPITDYRATIDYRRRMVQVMTKRALVEAVKGGHA